ncbi:TetR/AcrR family transcriptional regulator [Desulfosporosinus shakirovi]|uniref:TetR/AcrR family transcriptional regulator n=1 Tax=Desulfosporosinus shakirovi TaxID=2885154 RepID=UPI001E41993C|nr:TetR/AcrR family transcriptional regulator [Desulfosporosinus sp. SRJS8]MCB8817669.1 TetR/AcrR family transcriptional regulator [Desulfosporosinus sp. SRJS8]
MGGDDLTTLQKIMAEGKKEFLGKGFKDASLRNIVKRAGVTTGAFYGYYPDKKALFEALVLPAVNGLREMFLSAQEEFDHLPEAAKKENVYDYSSEEVKKFIAYIYDHFDELKLLISCSEGTAFSDFIHNLVEIEVEYTLRFLESTGNDALTSGRATPELLHIISSAFFSAIFEVVKHDMLREAADSYIESLRQFFTGGWKSILNP